nr:hypothetical protein [uncultured Flavobacterium sp.]
MKKLYICLMIVLCSMKGFAQYSEYGGSYYDSQFGQTGVRIIYGSPQPDWAAINAAQDAKARAQQEQMQQNIPKQTPTPPISTGGTTGGGSAPPKPSAPTPKPNIDPCAALAILNADTKYKEKLAEVIAKAKTDSTKEYGYCIASGASNYEPGTNDSKGDLDFPNDSKLYGIIHDHTLPRAGIDANGLPEIKKFIQMFSREDLRTFLMMLNNSANNGVSISDVFSTFSDNRGNVYTLKYEGTYNDIQGKSINVDALEKNYGLMLSNPKSYGGIENAFVAFLALEVKIPGITIYKTTPGTTPTKLGITSNGTKISSSNTPCK